jgi:hypothetical protein
MRGIIELRIPNLTHVNHRTVVQSAAVWFALLQRTRLSRAKHKY